MSAEELQALLEVPTTENPAPVEGAPFVGFTAEDLAKAREQEKQKLYPQLEKMKAEAALARKERDDLLAKEVEREKERTAEEAKKARKKKEKDEEELSFKELLEKKEHEFQAKLEEERAQRELAFATLDKEREYQELMNYRAARIEQVRDQISPQLIDLVTGSTAEEIEQSIQLLVDKTALIIGDFQQVVQAQKQQMPGTRVTAPASGPLDTNMAQQMTNPESVKNMSMADYIKNRSNILPGAANNRGQGLFG